MTKREKVYEKYNGHCAYCGNEISIKDMQIDHLIPKRLSHPQGFDSYYFYEGLNKIENLMPSCRICNHYKRGYMLEDYRELLLSLHKRIEKIYIVRVAIRYGLLELKKFDGKFYFEKLDNKY